jgi:hypothetical protein
VLPAFGQKSHVRVALIVIAFLITRLSILALFAPEIHAGDQVQYDRAARSIIDHGFRHYLNPGFVVQKGSYYPYFRNHPSLPDEPYNPIFWDPLYPLFLSAIYQVAGVSHGAVRLVQLLLSLLTLLIGMDTVRRLFPRHPRGAELFGWMTVAYLPFAGFVTKLLSETLDAFLLTSILWITTRLPRSLPGTFFAFGALLGLYASIKSYWVQLLPAVLVLTGWLLWRSERECMAWKSQALRLLLVLAGAALVLTPTYIRNHNVGAGTLLVSTKGGWNLWKDNNHFRIENHAWREPGLNIHAWLEAYYRLGSTDRVPTSLKGVYYDDAVTRIRPPCDGSLDELVACERRNAIAFFLEDPLRFARRALEKNANLWSPNNYIFSRAPPGPMAWNQNYRIELPTAARYLLQIWVIVCYLLAMLAFFVGIAAPSESAAHRHGRAFVVLFLLFLTLVVVPWGHGVTRFRLPYMVPILIFAVLGLTGARRVFPQPGRLDRRSVGRTAAVFALAALLAAVGVSRLPTLLAP